MKRSLEYGKTQIEAVASVRESVETSCFLSNVLMRDLQRDLAADDHEGLSLRNADIDLSSLRIVPGRELLQSKIDEALIFWEKLAERIPVKRQRPVGLRGRMAGGDDMFLDFDIDEKDVSPQPPPAAAAGSDVHLYQYYVQRLLCTVPRADALGYLTKEGPVPLRASRVKTLLDNSHTKKPNDRFLLREDNFAHMHVRPDRKLPGPSLGTGAAFASGTAYVAGGGAVAAGASPARAGATVAAVAEGTSAGESGPGEGSGWSASATPAPAALASAQTEKGSRVFQTFSGPSRAVVTFTLYRSAGPEGNGRPIEKKLFEVEALEHHTLQQVMETMPPCLADRILEEKRRGPRGEVKGDGGASPQDNRSKMSLGGGFVFMRGIFYVTRPAKGEDTRDIPLPPPKLLTANHPKLGVKVRKADTMAATNDSHGKPGASAASAAATGSAATPPNPSTDSLSPPPPQPPPDPWMRRWLQVGSHDWDTFKNELLELSEELQREREGGTQRQEERNGNTAAEEDARSEAAAAAIPLATGAGAGAGGAGVPAPAPRVKTWGNRLRGGAASRGRVPPARPRGPEEGRLSERGIAGEKMNGQGRAAEEKNGGGDGATDGEEKEHGEDAEARGPRSSAAGIEAATTAVTPESIAARAVRNATARTAAVAAAAAATAVERAVTAGSGRAGISGEGKDKDKGKGKDKETGKGKGGKGRAHAATNYKQQQQRGEGHGEEEHVNEEGYGTSRRPAAGGAAAKAPRKWKRGKVGNGKTAGAGAAFPGRGGKNSLKRAEIGTWTRRKLGMNDDGGEVLWAADATVADLRPVLGERYAFVHHRDCDHWFVVSDIRMDPVSPPPNTAAAGTPAAAGPEMSSSSVVGGGARQQQGCGQGTASSQEGTQLASAGAAASAAASGTIGNSSRFNRSSSSNGGGVPAGLGNGTAMGTAAAGRTRVGGEGKAGGGREEYPRLSFCAKPISRRCGICQTKTAIKTTVGHPLSDKVPLACCGGCFDALYLDAEQKPLEGELAGDVASTSPPRLASPGGDGNAATVERGDGGQVAGGPKGWKLVKCFHEP